MDTNAKDADINGYLEINKQIQKSALNVKAHTGTSQEKIESKIIIF